MALSIYEVVKGISQAIHNKHHGAIDETGKAVEIGLKREEQPIQDQKIMDGFGVAMHGNLLILKYNSFEPLSNLHEKRFEKEMERRIEEVRKFIVKEFNKVTGQNLRLKEAGEIKVLVESSNRVKALVKAMMPYEILNLKEVSSVGADKSSIAAGNLEKMKEYFGKQEKMVKKVKPSNITRPKGE
jgi:hypothetical protein